MADEQHQLRQINWKELFGFTQIFKGFKMAIHPSKLLLGIAAVLGVFVLGYVLSFIWGLFGWNLMYLNQGTTNEIGAYYRARDYYSFDQDKQAAEETQLDRAAALYSEKLSHRRNLSNFRTTYLDRTRPDFSAAWTKVAKADDSVEPKTPAKILEDNKDASPADLVDQAEEVFAEEVEKLEEWIDEAYKQARDELKNKDDEDLRDQAETQIKQDYIQALALLSEYKADFAERVIRIKGRGIFPALLDYEVSCVKNAIAAALSGNFLTGLWGEVNNAEAKAMPVAAAEADAPAAFNPGGNTQPGFFAWLVRGAYGICWLVREHWVFASLLLLGSLAICAVFGGAIARIAALEFCRQERISIGQALGFSCSKALSFFSAPLIPILLSAAAGLMLALGGLAGSIPYAGDIFLLLFMLIAIPVGMGIAFLLIGLIAGSGLMYPTIAVEGSDSFDSMGRTFSYIFGRPWHAAFYGLAAIIYGAITYLFVRLFLYLGLLATHTTLAWGVLRGPADGPGSGVHPYADKLDLFWPQPTFTQLFRGLNWDALNGWEVIWAFGIGIFVFLVASVAFAYLLSYYFSASTIIYCLLRRKIDATDLDEAYTEEFDQQLDWAAEAAETETAEQEPDKAEPAEEPKDASPDKEAESNDDSEQDEKSKDNEDDEDDKKKTD